MCKLKDTHLWFEKMFKPINNILEGTPLKGVIFEDIWSSHITNYTLEYFDGELKNFLKPGFLPDKMKPILQIIEWNIRLIYKYAVYVSK